MMVLIGNDGDDGDDDCGRSMRECWCELIKVGVDLLRVRASEKVGWSFFKCGRAERRGGVTSGARRARRWGGVFSSAGGRKGGVEFASV